MNVAAELIQKCIGENARVAQNQGEYVFLGKCHVDYVNSPISPAIHNPKDNTDWEVEEWVSGLSDDHGILALMNRYRLKI